MTRTALYVVLAVFAALGLVFGIYPELDLWLAGLMFDPQTGYFMIRPWISAARDGSMWLVTAMVVPSVAALLIKLAFPRQRLLVSARAILFLLGTLAIGPGLVTNVVLKNEWGRSRPIDVQQFGGPETFVAWWDPRGDCPKNCSFVSGDVSGAFWTLAPAALAPPAWRTAAYTAAIAFGGLVGLARMAFGGHFFTDVAFAGLFTFLVIWLVHGLIYRWRPTRLSDEVLERRMERQLERMRQGLVAAPAALRGRLRRIRK
jgi:lipid A 4'-phosphatase